MLGLVFVTQMRIRICIDGDTEVPSQMYEHTYMYFNPEKVKVFVGLKVSSRL